jgi:GxxExxY protein
MASKNKILHKDLSYKVQGAIYDVAKKYGTGLKEIIYEKALVEVLTKENLKTEEQKRITIYSVDTGRPLGTYVPDLIVEDAIVVEIKASSFTTKQDLQQQMSYLKASKFEVAYLVNFGTPQLYMKRTIYTNDRKPFLNAGS